MGKQDAKTEAGHTPRHGRKEADLTRVGILGSAPGYSMAALLRRAEVDLADAEPAPKQTSDAIAARHGYGWSSVRSGTLGEVRQILQLVQSLASGKLPKHWIWTAPDGSFVDGLRPDIEQVGFLDKTDLLAYRRAHLLALARLFSGISTLILPLHRTRGYEDVDGAVYPGSSWARPPRMCKLHETAFDQETIAADFAALHTALATLRPGLTLRLMVPQPTTDAPLPDHHDCANLRVLAVDWAKRHAGVVYDPLLDLLLARFAVEPDADHRLAGLIGRMVAGDDLLDAIAAAPAAEVPPSQDKTRDRALRREVRQKARKGIPAEARVMCEDELLEAFSG